MKEFLQLLPSVFALFIHMYRIGLSVLGRKVGRQILKI